MSDKTYLDDFHINLRGMTGKDITKLFIKLTKNYMWTEPGIKYYFYDFVRILGSGEIPDPEKFCFTIEPNSTPNQPYNGIIKFEDVQGCQTKWTCLENYVNIKTFRDVYRDYLNYQVNRKYFRDSRNIACVLLSFEIARREEVISGKYPITRKMTNDAIEKVFFGTTAEEYEDKVGLLMEMFQSGRWQNNYAGRKEAYNEIMGYSTGQSSSYSDDLIPRMQGFSLWSN